MRIGICTGYCNVGNFGSYQRMAYTIIGGPVNKAERLQSICEAGGIALASETHVLVKDHFDIRAGAPVQLRGGRTEIVPYGVLGIYDAESTPGRPSSAPREDREAETHKGGVRRLASTRT